MKRENLWKFPKKFLIGIDEAGRGPLAGPVAVGVVSVPFDFEWSQIPRVGDSKKVTPKHREAIFKHAETLRKKNKINFAVVLISHTTIDNKGISHAVKVGIERGLKKLALDPRLVEVRLDGLLKAPEEYEDQETIIKGDAKEKVIGLASILAKVTRDAYMVRMAEEYPQYHFEMHKGYGTKLHLKALEVHGFSALHRRSFCEGVCTRLGLPNVHYLAQ